METKYQNLEELKEKKEKLKLELQKIEQVLSFEEPKKSLDIITNGYTQNLIKEVKSQDDDRSKLALNTEFLMQKVSDNIREQFNKNKIMELLNTDGGKNLLKNSVQIGATSIISGYLNRNLKNSSSWKKKALGMFLLYATPFVIQLIKDKINQKK